MRRARGGDAGGGQCDEPSRDGSRQAAAGDGQGSESERVGGGDGAGQAEEHAAATTPATQPPVKRKKKEKTVSRLSFSDDLGDDEGATEFGSISQSTNLRCVSARCVLCGRCGMRCWCLCSSCGSALARVRARSPLTPPQFPARGAQTPARGGGGGVGDPQLSLSESLHCHSPASRRSSFARCRLDSPGGILRRPCAPAVRG
jgi:hypothetical protein